MGLQFSAIFDRRGMTSRKKKRPNTAGQNSESKEQQALFAWWQYTHHSLGLPETVLFAVPNGGRRDAVTGARLKAEGVRAGIPDICLAVARGGYHGLFLELKRPETPGSRKGQVSASQKVVQEALREQGYQCAVCYGARDAVSAICAYLTGGKAA